MPPSLDVSPTRGSLLKLRDQLEAVQEGHRLLDRKRQVLLQKLFDMIEEVEQVHEEARSRFESAYQAITRARMELGIDKLRWIGLAPTADITVSVRERGIMGVRTALVQVDIDSLPIPYGPGDTAVALDEAHEKWLEVARILGRLTETTVTARRMAADLRKVRRRVNALEKTLIPQYQDAIRSIADALEENEREDIVYAKKAKRLHEGL